MVTTAQIPPATPTAKPIAFAPIFDLTTEDIVAVSVRADGPEGRLASIGELAGTGRLDAVLGHASVPRGAKVALPTKGSEVVRPEFGAWIGDWLDRWALPPSSIELHFAASGELTTDQTRRIDHLRTLGFRLCLTGFGEAGHSLEWLREVAFDLVELASPYLRNLGRSPRDKLMFATLVELGHRLGATVGIDGLSTEAELVFARTIGVDRALGRYWNA